MRREWTTPIILTAALAGCADDDLNSLGSTATAGETDGVGETDGEEDGGGETDGEDAGDSEGEAPVEPEHAGVWSGETADGLAALLEVSEDDEVTAIALELEIDIGIGTCTGVFVAEPDLAIDGGEVRYEGTLENPAGAVDGVVSVTFADGVADGSYDFDSFAVVCGGYASFGSGGPSGAFSLAREG
jgi:hypothetical protein